MSQYYKVVGQSAGSSFQKSGAPSCARERALGEGEVGEYLFARAVQGLFEGKSSTHIIVTDDAQGFAGEYFGSSGQLPEEFRTRIQKAANTQFSYTLQAF